MNNQISSAALMLLGITMASGSMAASSYLNQSNITVALGAGTSPGSFNNTFNNGATINKVIDAPSAAAEEFHDQVTHIWFTADQVGGGLELKFDFGAQYNDTTFRCRSRSLETRSALDSRLLPASDTHAPTREWFSLRVRIARQA